jgi:methionyl aminopeptidase
MSSTPKTLLVAFIWGLSLFASFRYIESYILNKTSPTSLRYFSQLLMGKGFGFSPPVKYTGKLRPGVVGPTRPVPEHIMKPDYALDGIPKSSRSRPVNPWEIIPTSEENIKLMKIAGRHAREVLDAAIRAVKVGMTTDEIDAIVHEETIKRNCYPSPLNYNHFPKSCCTSLNEVICHGIPDSTVLHDGDIMNIDVTVYYQGVHGDCSETVLVGNDVDPAVKDLVRTTYESLEQAIKICKPNVNYNQIGEVIENIAKAKKCTSCKQFCGHG